jgi:hypothetical protein
MLTAIVQHSEELVAFITALSLALYQPQIRRLIQMVDALITSSETKTGEDFYRTNLSLALFLRFYIYFCD